MIESMCAVLNGMQDPLNTVNMEICVRVWEFSQLLYVYLDMTETMNIHYWWTKSQSQMYF